MGVRPFSYSFVVPISLLAFVSSSCSKEAPAFTNASTGSQDIKETGVDSSESNASGRRDGSNSEGSMDSGLPPNPDALFGPQAGPSGDPTRSGSPDTTGNQVGGGISGELGSGSGGTNPSGTQNPTAVAVSKTFEVKTSEAVSGAFFVDDRWTSQPIMMASKGTQLSAFDLGSPAYMGSVSVTVDRVSVPANAFSVAGQTLSFAAPPPPDSQIAALFKKDISLVSSFGLGLGVVASTLQVRVNGQAAQGATFDAATGTLKIIPAPEEGAAIEAVFRRLTAAETRYPILLSSQATTDVRAQYDDNTPVAVAISSDGAQNYVTVTQAAQVRVGSNLWVQYRVAGQTANTFQLPSTPIPGTLVLTSSLETCKVGKDIMVSGNSIQVACPGATMLKIGFAFERYLDPNREFVFTGVGNPDSLTWEVFVDGKALLEAGLFRREGNKIILSSQVPLENSSMVAIRAYLKQM